MPKPKSTLKPAPTRPGRGKGSSGALRSGNPGNKGGSGRPPDEFKRRMRELASSEASIAYLEQCINGVHGPKAAASAREYATERGYGKVPTEIKADVVAHVLVVSNIEDLPATDDN